MNAFPSQKGVEIGYKHTHAHKEYITAVKC